MTSLFYNLHLIGFCFFPTLGLSKIDQYQDTYIYELQTNTTKIIWYYFGVLSRRFNLGKRRIIVQLCQ